MIDVRKGEIKTLWYGNKYCKILQKQQTFEITKTIIKYKIKKKLTKKYTYKVIL